MEGTGGTTEEKKSQNEIPKSMWKYLPSIHEQGLADKGNTKKRQSLFDSYLKPNQNDSKSLDI